MDINLRTMKRHYSDSFVTLVHNTNVFSKKLYVPRRRDDLVINRNRVKDVGDWIDDAFRIPRVSLLLLCGPPGCGKTTVIRVLAAEKGIEIIEWITPADSYEFSDGNDYRKPVSVAYKFKQFLLGVGRYSSVIKNTISPTSKGKLILVKDFPTFFLSSPNDFTEIIDFYVTHGCAPVIFICTESAKKKCTDIAFELFKEEFKTRNNIVQVTFIPVSVTSVLKALKNIVKVGRISMKDDILRNIAVESHGDLQKAINDLKVLSVSISKSTNFGSNPHTKMTKSQNTKKSNTLKDADKETTGLFHSVGRVLYAKRDAQDDVSKEGKQYNNVSGGELVHKPLDIAREFSHYSNQFVSIAHTNYLDIFSSIECIAKAAEYLSDSDIIMSEWREEGILSTLGFSVAVGGLMESNRDPIRKWKPLTGSVWNDDLKTSVANRTSVRILFSDYHGSENDIILELVPYLIQMWCSRNKEFGKIKRCLKGFLPHQPDELVSEVRKIKTDFLSYPLSHLQGQTSDSDSSIHISDDSD